MIQLDIQNGRFVFEAPTVEKDRIRQVPGVTWDRVNKNWTAPLTWATALAARGAIGKDLSLSDEAVLWGMARLSEVWYVDTLKSTPPLAQEYGFQETGVAFLGRVGAAVLGDEPGLGKTRQALLAAEGPVLVVSTTSMLRKWVNETRRWRPDLEPVLLVGSAARRTKLLAALPENGVAVINWQALRTLSRLAPYGSIHLTDKEKVPGPLNRPWGTMICDEAHAMKDPHSKQTRAAWAIGATSERRYALTATLSPEGPADLWGVMHWVYPAEYPSRTQFIDRYVVVTPAFWGGLQTYGLRPDTAREFFGFFDPRYLRRTKAQCLPQLPAKTYTTRYVDMGTVQARQYRDLEDRFVARVEGGILAAPSPLQQHTRLIQAASATLTLNEETGEVDMIMPSCKIQALLEIIDEGRDSIVVFSPSRKLIHLASEELSKAGILHGLITGLITPEARQEAVDNFQSGATRVILCTTKTGGEGIDLTRASRLVFLNRPERAVEGVQAEDRVHRIGQDQAVEIIDIVTDETVEADVHASLGVKADLAQEVARDPEYTRHLIEARKKA